MTRRVPLKDTAKAMKADVLELLGEFERYLKFHALREAYEHSQTIGPRDTGKATYGLNPSAVRPVPLMHEDRPAFPTPGAERLLPLLPQLDPGVHAYLTYHALDSRGEFDYAGIMLENGWSKQAPFGVLAPTKKHVEARAPQIAREAAADAMRGAA